MAKCRISLPINIRSTEWETKYGFVLSLDGLRPVLSGCVVDHRAGVAEGHSLGVGLFVLSGPSVNLRRPKLEACEIGILPPVCDYWKVDGPAVTQLLRGNNSFCFAIEQLVPDQCVIGNFKSTWTVFALIKRLESNLQGKSFLNPRYSKRAIT